MSSIRQDKIDILLQIPFLYTHEPETQARTSRLANLAHQKSPVSLASSTPLHNPSTWVGSHYPLCTLPISMHPTPKEKKKRKKRSFLAHSPSPRSSASGPILINSLQAQLRNFRISPKRITPVSRCRVDSMERNGSQTPSMIRSPPLSSSSYSPHPHALAKVASKSWNSSELHQNTSQPYFPK